MPGLVPCRCRLSGEAIEVQIDPPQGCKVVEISWPAPSGKQTADVQRDSLPWHCLIDQVDAKRSPESVLVLMHVNEETWAFNLPETLGDQWCDCLPQAGSQSYGGMGCDPHKGCPPSQ